MDHLERNRQSWNSGVMSTSGWASPVCIATRALRP